MKTAALAATVGGRPIPVSEVDDREVRMRSGGLAGVLPKPGTSEGRQLRRWLTQLLVTERLVAAEAAELGLTGENAPAEEVVLPDATTRLEIGSVAAAALADPLARALFEHVTRTVEVTADDVADYHARNPFRFAARDRATVSDKIREHLRAAARRRAFRLWLDARQAALVKLAPGYEHPGDPRQPDNTHRH
jgi:[acyl-carrier-protein] S-malonyltransferase